ncbi:MAG: aminopeptidase P family protein [candidate division WOR-3 bacterium]|nr:aminopeptidase P family protein [candidate division WOR-3 bacterium]MCX7836496.1 aminopeptidase P family protein [candidate division WOR-3 bacterium]MDW8114525.1 aminopeptidase P family protein [candidate division WOR-3 bacterium]
MLQIYKERQKKVFDYLSKNNIDSFLVSDLVNIRYLANFTGSNGYLLFFDSKVYFYTDFRYELQSKREVICDEIIIIKKNLFASPPKEFLKFKRLGIEKENITLDSYNKILEYFKKKNKRIKIIPLPNFIKEEFRAVKDEEEIKLISKAAEITDRVFLKVLEEIKEGVREKELAFFIESEFRKEGELSFPVIVASGENSALPHARASDKKIKSGEAIVIDIGCRYQGYCSDMTRTVFFGKVNKELKEIYQIVYDAQKRAIDFLWEDKKIKAKELDSKARDYIKNKNYGKYFGHGLGHGVGLEVHEKPWVSFLSKDKIKENMIFTIEPGIYLPNIGGVRIEDLILYKEKEIIFLSKSDKKLLVL